MVVGCIWCSIFACSAETEADPKHNYTGYGEIPACLQNACMHEHVFKNMVLKYPIHSNFVITAPLTTPLTTYIYTVSFTCSPYLYPPSLHVYRYLVACKAASQQE